MSQKKSEEVARKPAAEGELHKPPSMLWFLIPLGIVMAYAVLSAR